MGLIGGPILNPSPETCARALEEGISVPCIGLDVLAFRRLAKRRSRPPTRRSRPTRRTTGRRRHRARFRPPTEIAGAVQADGKALVG